MAKVICIFCREEVEEDICGCMNRIIIRKILEMESENIQNPYENPEN